MQLYQQWICGSMWQYMENTYVRLCLSILEHSSNHHGRSFKDQTITIESLVIEIDRQVPKWIKFSWNVPFIMKDMACSFQEETFFGCLATMQCIDDLKAETDLLVVDHHQ